MNDKFRDVVTQDTMKDDDVMFYWCISSASMSQDCADKLLKKIVDKWLSMLRNYERKKQKKGTQKSKVLRIKLAEKNQ